MTPASSSAAGRQPGFDDSRWAGVRPRGARLGDPGRSPRTSGPPHRDARAGRDHDVALGPDDRRLRSEPGRPAAADGSAALPGKRSRCAMPRCSRTASCARGRSGLPRRPTATCSRAKGPPAKLALRPGNPASPSTASAMPRSTAGRASWPAVCRPGPSWRSSSTRTWNAPAGSNAPTRSSTGCMKMSSGACAATSSTSRPTARSATSALAGPATSRCSRRRRAFSTTRPVS